MKRIAAIHDISGLGKCSLTVALPIISASGVECSCIPTALLSTHTGEFEGWTCLDLSSQMLAIAEHWQRIGVEFDGIYSGYLASPKQERILEGIVDRIAGKNTLVITDPAMADNGKYYSGFDDEMCDAFVRLCKRSDIITPNITEAALLGGLTYRKPPHDEKYVNSLFSALSGLGVKTIAITGIHHSETEVGIVVKDTECGITYEEFRSSRPGNFYGVGDIFASAFSALLVRGASVADALKAAGLLLNESIERSFSRNSPRRFGVDFERALPNYINHVEELFSSRLS